MSFTENAWKIFNLSVEDYHIKDDVNSYENNPFQTGSLEWILYSKNWIDTVQWHLEDIIREEDIDPTEALKIKRRIDALNQKAANKEQREAAIYQAKAELEEINKVKQELEAILQF